MKTKLERENSNTYSKNITIQDAPEDMEFRFPMPYKNEN